MNDLRLEMLVAQTIYPPGYPVNPWFDTPTIAHITVRVGSARHESPRLNLPD